MQLSSPSNRLIPSARSSHPAIKISLIFRSENDSQRARSLPDETQSQMRAKRVICPQQETLCRRRKVSRRFPAQNLAGAPRTNDSQRQNQVAARSQTAPSTGIWHTSMNADSGFSGRGERLFYEKNRTGNVKRKFITL